MIGFTSALNYVLREILNLSISKNFMLAIIMLAIIIT